MNHLIALHSPAPQSGKTEFAKIATEQFGYYIVPFAAPVKDMLFQLLSNFYSYETVYEMLYGSQKGHMTELGMDARSLMVSLATAWGRNMVHSDIWVKPWKRKVTKMLQEGKKVIVDDMRFPNEFQAVESLDGWTIRIERPDSVTKDTKSEGLLNLHDFNTTMFNTRELKEWQEYCEEILWYMWYMEKNNG